MAISCSSSPHITIQMSSPIKKPVGQVVLLKQSQIPVKKTPTLQIRSSFTNKVFEDRSRGIVCYRDDSGEIICEGYDEGPRLHLQFPGTSRDVDIVDLLQQSWLQIVGSAEYNNLADKDATAQDDVNWNGFNTFC